MLTEADPEATVIEPLEWVMDSDTEAAIEASLAKSVSCGVETLEYTDFGKRFITGNKCSPDGFAQAAMMLTFVARAPKHSSNSSSTAEAWTWLSGRWTLRPAGNGDQRTRARRCDRNELTQVLRRGVLMLVLAPHSLTRQQQ